MGIKRLQYAIIIAACTVVLSFQIAKCLEKYMNKNTGAILLFSPFFQVFQALLQGLLDNKWAKFDSVHKILKKQVHIILIDKESSPLKKSES